MHACGVIVLHERRVLHERCVVRGGSGERDGGFVSFLLACGPCGDSLMCSVPVQLEVCSPSIHTQAAGIMCAPLSARVVDEELAPKKAGWRMAPEAVRCRSSGRRPRPQDKGLPPPADSAPQAARRM